MGKYIRHPLLITVTGQGTPFLRISQAENIYCVMHSSKQLIKTGLKETTNVKVLTLPMLRLLSSNSHLNPVVLVFIVKLSLSTLR